MPDGQGYSGNAQKAAAHATQCSKNGCPNCVKQGLPVLLAIPTLADKTYADTQHATIAKLLKGTADPELTYSGHITRTLRQGYVMAWYENPPKCMAHEEGWTIARVDDGGYMTQTTFAALGLGSAESGSKKSKAKHEPFSCSRASSYAAAMLFVVPEAKTTGKVWIAFSSHPWSPGVRKKYAGGNDAFRKKAMTCIDATQASCERSIKLTKANIRAAVPDSLPGFDAGHIAGNPFPPPNVLPAVTVTAGAVSPAKADPGTDASGMDAMMLNEANKALGSEGDFTIDDAMIVCLADPEGVTTTAAQRRMTLCNRANDWVAQFRDDNGVANGAWRLQSALTVKGLLKIFDQQAAKHIEQEASYDASYRGQKCTQAEFAKLKAEGKLPPDATLERVPEFDNPAAMGRGTPTGWHEVIKFPSDWAINAQRDRLKEQITERLTGTAKGKNWQAFLTEYQNRSASDHDLLSKVELDHKAWLQSPLFEHLYTHNFDDTDPRDGMPYAGCVSHCLMGGPISKDALAWWKDFLADDPSAKNNLLVRAMLGNQKKYFDWISSTDTKATAYDEARGLLDVVAAVHEKGGHASDKQAEGFAQSLLSTAGALAARMDEAKVLSSTLRGRLKRLGLGLIARSESSLFLYKLRVPVGVAGKLWRNMAGAAQVATHKTVETGGRKIKSLVLGGTMALELEGSPKAANALVDVYLWSRGQVKVEVGKVDGKFKLTTTEVLGEGQAAFATGLTQETAEALSKNSMRLLRGAGSGLLSAGSGFLQVLILGEAWEQFEHGTKEDQKAAAVTLLTSGIGIGAACMEISGVLAKQFEKEALEKGLKMFAARASAAATAVVAFQSAVDMYKSLRQGDGNAAVGYTFQALFFGAAAFAGFETASGIAAGTEVATAITVGGLELSWTGIGLIFVALGVLAGFVILILKDTPLEAWAAESIWGKASDKYASLAREQEALNEAFIGAEVDFAYGVFAEGTFWSNLFSSVGTSQYNRSAGLTGQPLMAQTLEARLRLILPKVVKGRLPWLLQINASRKGAGMVEVAHWDSTGVVSLEGDHAAQGLYDASHKEDAVAGNDKITSLELSVRLDVDQYRDAFAIVRVADAATAAKDALAGTGSYIIEYDHLSG